MFSDESVFSVLFLKRLVRSLVLWVNLLLFGIIFLNEYLIATVPRPLPLPYYEATQIPPQECEFARVQLIADTSIVVPGESFLLGIRFELEKDWHLYWENPGSSGFPLSVDWNLPTGFEVGPLQFPSPQRYELSGFVTYVHEEAPMFIVRVTVPNNTPVDTPVIIQASAQWLLCKDECIADSTTFSLEIPVGESEVPDNTGWFAKALAEQPETSKEVALTMTVREEQLDLELDLEGLTLESTTEVYFYPRMEGIINPNAPQMLVKKAAGGIGLPRLELSFAQTYLDNTIDELANFSGVLEVESRDWLRAASLAIWFIRLVALSFSRRNDIEFDALCIASFVAKGVLLIKAFWPISCIRNRSWTFLHFRRGPKLCSFSWGSLFTAQCW